MVSRNPFDVSDRQKGGDYAEPIVNDILTARNCKVEVLQLPESCGLSRRRLACIAALTQLRQLDLEGCKTDAGLTHFLALQQARRYWLPDNLRGSRVAAASEQWCAQVHCRLNLCTRSFRG